MPRKTTQADRQYSASTTNVRVKLDTYDRLRDEAEYGDSMDTVIRRLLDLKEGKRVV